MIFRNTVIIILAAALILGTALFFGIRAAGNRSSESKDRTSTSTETQREGRGFFGILRRDFFSKSPFEKKESGFQLNMWEDFGITPSDSRGAPGESVSGFVLRQGVQVLSSGTKQVSIAPVSPRVSKKPPFGFTKEELSPFFGRVTIAALQHPQRSDYDRTSIVLFANFGLSAPIPVTGWTIQTHSGNVFIPQGIEDYAPGSSLAGDILLQGGQTLSLFGHYRFSEYQHPFGKNLRLNRCTGYLNSIYSFNPKLPEKCPTVSRGELSVFSGACQSFLMNLGKCRVPTSEDINAFQGDAACQSFMRDTFGYGLCYNTHHTDSDFFSNEWYAWTNPQTQIPLARDHDRVLLFDRNGFLVDELSY